MVLGSQKNRHAKPMKMVAISPTLTIAARKPFKNSEFWLPTALSKKNDMLLKTTHTEGSQA